VALPERAPTHHRASPGDRRAPFAFQGHPMTVLRHPMNMEVEGSLEQRLRSVAYDLERKHRTPHDEVAAKLDGAKELRSIADALDRFKRLANQTLGPAPKPSGPGSPGVSGRRLMGRAIA
jgi:hypothetical protein